MEKRRLYFMGCWLNDCEYKRQTNNYDIYTFSSGLEYCYVVVEQFIVIAMFANYADLDAFLKARNEVE